MRTERTRSAYRMMVVLVLASAMAAMASCNTWRGAGKDVERTGEAIQGE